MLHINLRNSQNAIKVHASYILFFIIYKSQDINLQMSLSSRSPQSASKRYYFQLLPTAIQALNYKQINDQKASTINYKFSVNKGNQQYGENKIPISIKTYEHPQTLQLNEGSNIINFYIPVYNPHRQVNFTLKIQRKYTEQSQFKVIGQINIDSNKIVEAYNNQGKKNQLFLEKVGQNLTLCYQIFIEKDRNQLNNLVKESKPNLVYTPTIQNNEIIKSLIDGSNKLSMSQIQFKLASKKSAFSEIITSKQQAASPEKLRKAQSKQDVSDISPGRPSLSKNWSKKSNPSDIEPLNEKYNEAVVEEVNRILQVKSSKQIPQHPFGQNPKLPKQAIQHLQIQKNQQKQSSNIKNNGSIQSKSISLLDNQGDQQYIHKDLQSNQSPKISNSNIANRGSNEIFPQKEQQIRVNNIISEAQKRLIQQRTDNRLSYEQQEPKIRRIKSITHYENTKSNKQLYLQIFVLVLAILAFYYFILHPIVQRNLFRAPKKIVFGQ